MTNIKQEIIIDIAGKLKQNKLLIATAESCTGGLLAHLLTNLSGSSEYFERGLVTYSNESKIQLLDVPEEIITQYGAVSKQTAEAMSIGIKKNSKADIGISTTGIAGPKGGTKEKPVGLVYIGITTNKKTSVKRFIFYNNRIENKESACFEALKFLLNTISNW